MSIPLTINGATYDYPEARDNQWGPDATDWASAVTSGMLQKAGGLFQLLDEVDFGSAYGIKSLYYTSRTTNVAAAGQIRFARADVLSWRNQANGADLPLGVNSSDELTFDGVPLQTGSITVSDTATIDMTLSADDISAVIVNDSITNAMINSAAAIAGTKISPNFGSQEVVTTGHITAGNSNATTPSFNFSGASNLGMYNAGSNTLGLVSAGTDRVFINATAVSVVPPVRGAAGTAGAPTYSFTSDTDSGFYSAGVGTIAMSVDAAAVWSATASANTFYSPLLAQNGTAGDPSFSFANDTDLGLYRIGANAGGFTGSLTISSTVAASNLSGSNTGDQTITLTGDVTGTGTGTFAATIAAGVIVNNDINASAAIDFSKLAALTDGNILIGNVSNVAASVAVTGDVTISNAGVTAIGSGVIVNADVNASAAIAGSKITPDFGAQNVVTTGTGSFGTAFIAGAATTGVNLTVGNTNAQTAVTQADFQSRIQGTATATTEINSFTATPTTSANSFTAALISGFKAAARGLGATSSATRVVQFYSASAPTQGGTGNAVLADNAAFSGNFFINSTTTNTSLFSGVVNCSAGVRTKYATTNTANPPTQAEMVTAFGVCATNGSGFIGVLNDNAGGTNVYFVYSDGTNYFYILGTVGA